MSDQEKPPTSAAAMDALDLDDLFLGGVEDVVGDVDGPDSLFANMEIDLGEMGGIFDAGVDAVGGGSATNNNNNGAMMMRNDDRRSSTPSGGGGGDVLTQEFGRQSFNSTGSSSGGVGGGARDRKRVRTAKTNP